MDKIAMAAFVSIVALGAAVNVAATRHFVRSGATWSHGYRVGRAAGRAEMAQG